MENPDTKTTINQRKELRSSTLDPDAHKIRRKGRIRKSLYNKKTEQVDFD